MIAVGSVIFDLIYVRATISNIFIFSVVKYNND